MRRVVWEYCLTTPFTRVLRLQSRVGMSSGRLSPGEKAGSDDPF
jgi:hypothetical protein